jgi:hypothetical protein
MGNTNPMLLFPVAAIVMTLVVCVPVGLFLSKKFPRDEVTALPTDFMSYENVGWTVWWSNAWVELSNPFSRLG